MDVARILALEPRELESTDTALHALQALHNSEIRTVHIFGRRGPEHAAFTSPELRELPKLEHTNVVIDDREIADAINRAENTGEIPKDVKANLDAMLLIAKSPSKNHDRTLIFHFLTSPIEIKGKERVEEVIFAVNEVQDGEVVQTNETHAVKTGLIVSAIGYESESIPGIPYEGGKVVNEEGRVKGTNIYVVGWAKRGPSGVIGTNKSDSASVIEHLVADLNNPKNNNGIVSLLKERGVVHISQGNWEKLNSAEIAAGTPSGKPRIKFVDRKEMLGFAE